MKLCLQSVNEIEKGIQKHISPEWLVSDVKQAIYHLAQITGDVTSEDILDSIFSRFCIGK
jgi:tRNA modification GTPase